MTLHDLFGGLLSTGQWWVIFIVLGIILAVVFDIKWRDDTYSGGGAWFFGFMTPILVWFAIMILLHFIDFLIFLWNMDYILGPQR